MQRFAISFSLGVMLAATFAVLPALPAVLLLVAITALVCALAYFLKLRIFLAGCLCLLFFGLGGSYGVWQNQQSLGRQLPADFDGSIVSLQGLVVDIYADTTLKQRFKFQIDASVAGLPDSAHLLLGWYGHEEDLAIGQRWQLRVKLRAPRGFVNPASLDYQGLLLRRNISATGTVKSGKLLAGNSDGLALAVERVRHNLRQWLDGINIANKRFFKALVIGDKSSLTSDDWLLLQQTGTIHLMAISGLHIGLLAMCGYWFGTLLGRCINLISIRISALLIADCCAVAVAGLYAALAGFSTPTSRALIMVMAVYFCIRLCRPIQKGVILSAALLLVVLAEPTAIWNAGFWLSFLAVLVLMLIFTGRRVNQRSGYTWFVEIIRSQWYLFAALLLPILYFMQRAPLLSPLANLLAIPVVSLLVVPLLLVATLVHGLLQGIAPLAADYPLQLADSIFSMLLAGLEILVEVAPDFSVVGAPQGLLLAAGAGAALLLLIPKGIPGRLLGYPLLMLVFFLARERHSDFEITFLDVGQGMAVVVEAGGKRLVYDTGRRYSANFDSGSGVVSPFLDSKGRIGIDRLIISHGDSDHSGGAAPLSIRHPIEKVLAPKSLADCLITGSVKCFPQGWQQQPSLNPLRAKSFGACNSNESWVWGQTEFTLFAAPFNGDEIVSANNQSCLVLIRYGNSSFLLTGDIEVEAEQLLLAGDLLPENINWLSAPHHGSKTSSSPAFIRHLRPKNVVFQYGHNNSYRHPNVEVLARYKEAGVELFKIDEIGALQITINSKEGSPESIKVTRWRTDHRRFWF